MEQNLISSLRTQFKQLRTLFLLYLLAAVLALVLFFWNQVATLVVLGTSLLYHFLLVRPRSRSYEAAYVHACVQLTLERHLTQAHHTAEPTLTEDELRAARLIADNCGPGSILLREGGAGLGNGREIRLGDATFAHSFPMDGKTHHEFVTGCWIRVPLTRDTGLDWRSLPPQVMLPASRVRFREAYPDLEGLALDNPLWKDCLILRPAGTPDLPAPGVLRALEALRKHSTARVAVCVQGNILHVFLVNRTLGQKVNIRLAPSSQQLERDLLPELKDILSLADRLEQC
ncbi:MAG: hypothetical protein VB096_00830 [Pseudoflavonifractor sp.]|nr:hypothetical protein [Pseudoflavonifractor sp.]